ASHLVAGEVCGNLLIAFGRCGERCGIAVEQPFATQPAAKRAHGGELSTRTGARDALPEERAEIQAHRVRREIPWYERRSGPTRRRRYRRDELLQIAFV